VIRKRKATKKSSAVAKPAARPVPAAPAVEGLAVTTDKAAAHVVTHDGSSVNIAPGKTRSFQPVQVNFEGTATPEVPGFRQAPPSSVIWLSVALDNKAKGTITLDPTAIIRDGARWGRPVILAYESNSAAVAWTTVSFRRTFSLSGAARLHVIGVGHGVAVDAPGVFASLLQKAATARDVSRAARKKGRK
jgi:hypothetical protein